VDVSEKCDRCGRTYTQVIEDGEVARSQLRPLDKLCVLIEIPLDPDQQRFREAAARAISQQSSRSVSATPRPVQPPPRICRVCIEDYVRHHEEFVDSWFTSYTPDEPTESVYPSAHG
jgi:hypothetical protein